MRYTNQSKRADWSPLEYMPTRNPLYLSASILFLGWSLVFVSTFLIIISILFIPLFRFAAKWEEQELTERFGEEYRSYKERVPFFFASILTIEN